MNELQKIAVLQGDPILGVLPIQTEYGIEYPTLFYASKEGNVYLTDPNLMSTISKLFENKIRGILENHELGTEIEIEGFTWNVTLEIEYDTIKEGYKQWERKGSLEEDYETVGIENVKLINIILC